MVSVVCLARVAQLGPVLSPLGAAEPDLVVVAFDASQRLVEVDAVEAFVLGEVAEHVTGLVGGDALSVSSPGLKDRELIVIVSFAKNVFFFNLDLLETCPA